VELVGDGFSSAADEGQADDPVRLFTVEQK
jgi:hypothetical protein